MSEMFVRRGKNKGRRLKRREIWNRSPKNDVKFGIIRPKCLSQGRKQLLLSSNSKVMIELEGVPQ